MIFKRDRLAPSSDILLCSEVIVDCESTAISLLYICYLKRDSWIDGDQLKRKQCTSMAALFELKIHEDFRFLTIVCGL